VLIRTLIVNKDGAVQRQALVMSLGIVVHGFGAESYAYLRIGVGTFPPPYLTLTALVMALSFAFAVLRYKMFVVVPRKEAPVALPRKFPIQAGRAYAVRERSPSTHLRALAEAVRTGDTGLIVSRRNPATLREDFDLQETPILWITETVGQNRVSPRSPAMVERLVDQFLRGNRRGVVAVDGIELIATEAGGPRTAVFLRYVRDAVTAGGGILLVSADMGSEQLGLSDIYDREFETLPIAAHEGYSVADVFVIDATTGLLLARANRESTMSVDADVMAGMLTAIMDFAKVSFSDGVDQLRRLDLGEKSVVIERGRRIIAAVVFSGKEPRDIHAELRAFLDRADDRYGKVLDHWSGNVEEIRGLEAMAGRLVL
jgi:Protein of unknown function (DUF835)